jgi:hypothetical protein
LRRLRAERRKPMVSAILADHGGRLAARHMRSSSGTHVICGVLLERFDTGPRFLDSDPPLAAHLEQNPRSRCEAGAKRSTISQLLAGTLSGPGRSPGPSPEGASGEGGDRFGYGPQGDAARVQVLRDRPAGAAPHPTSWRPMSAPLKWTRWPESNSGLECGDKFLYGRGAGDSRFVVSVFGRNALLKRARLSL